MFDDLYKTIKGTSDKNNTTKGGSNQGRNTETSSAATKIPLAKQQKKSAWPSQNQSTNASVGARAKSTNTKTQSSAATIRNSAANQQSGAMRSSQNQSTAKANKAATNNKKQEAPPRKKDWWDNLIDGAVNFGNGVADFGNDVMETVNTTVDNMGNAIVDAAGDVKESWDNNFGKNSSADRSTFDKVCDFTGKFFGEGVELVYTGGAELLSGSIQINTDAASRIAGIFSPDIAENVDTFGSLASNAVRVVGNKQADFAGEVAHGAIAGDAIEDPTTAQLVGQVAVGFIPGVDQIADVRDTIGAVISGDEERIMYASMGWIPEVGNVAKHYDELASVAGKGYKNLKSLDPSKVVDAFKKVPVLLENTEIFGTLAKNPEILELVVKNPEIIKDVAKNPDKLAEMMNNPKLLVNFINDPQYSEMSQDLTENTEITNFEFSFDKSTNNKIVLTAKAEKKDHLDAMIATVSYYNTHGVNRKESMWGKLIKADLDPLYINDWHKVILTNYYYTYNKLGKAMTNQTRSKDFKAFGINKTSGNVLLCNGYDEYDE
jgi:hypothetical protein